MAKFTTLSQEDFMLRFNNCGNTFVEIIGEYKGTDLPIKCKCLICGDEFESTPYRVLHGCKHNKCARKISAQKRKLSFEELCDRVKVVNPDIVLLDGYIDFHTKMKYRCVCGKIHEATPDHLLHGGLCYSCGRRKAAQNHKMTNEKILNLIQQYNCDIEILEPYTGIKNRILVKCKKCGYEWTPFAEQLVKSNANGCPKCCGRIVTNDEFCSWVKSNRPNLVPLGVYLKSNLKIKFYCKDCHSIVYMTPNKLKTGQGCPNCKRSHGETKIHEWLKSHDIIFCQQYRIVEDNVNLYFDFGIFQDNNIVALIEYDGKQHFEPVDFAGKGVEWANKQFNDNKRRDDAKDKYCNIHKIPLLRIPYWEYNNIESQLNTFLKEIYK